MTRSFIIPIVRLLDKCFEYVKGRGDQYLARARGKHPVRKGKRRKCTSCAYNNSNSNKWLDTRTNDYIL